MKISEHKSLLMYLFIVILAVIVLVVTGISKIFPFSIPLIVAIITTIFGYFNTRKSQKSEIKTEKIQDDDKLIKFSNIKLTEQDILQIQEGEKQDNIQELMDNIIKSFNNEELSLFRNLIEILGIKWNSLMDGFDKTSNTRFISSYFGEHYRKIIFKLIEREAKYEYYYPIILSFQSNVTKFLLSKKALDEDTYLDDSFYFANVFSLIIEKSIDESNESVFEIAIDMLREQMKSAIKFQMNDFNIRSFYIHNLDYIVEKACEKKFDIDFISVRLSWVGRYLASCEFEDSLIKLLNIFDSLIDFETEWNNKNNLIITERSLMYIWVCCDSRKTIKCNGKIVSILRKIDAEPYINITLTCAYDKMQELLNNDKERENLVKITDRLDILRMLLR